MLNITDCEKIGNEIGTISVSIYKDKSTGLSAFNINADENVVHVSYVIEDILKMI